jgi:uncharacterized protein (UPF0332 family)
VKPETAELLDKAEENIRAADTLIKAQFFEIAVSRGYYAIFYVARALLVEEGKTGSSHREVQSTFGVLFTKTAKLDSKYHRYLLDSFRKRQVADYQHEANVSEAEAIEVINHAEEFLVAAKAYLSTGASPTPTYP